MKTIKGLLSKPVPTEMQIEKGIKEVRDTYRKMFKQAVEHTLGKSKENAIENYQLGLKLMQDQDEIQLEDAEFKLLKEACESNPLQWISHFQAQILIKLKESERK